MVWGFTRDPCDAVTFQNGQFFGGDGIRTADLHRDLRTGGEVEGFFQSRQDGIHLIRRQDAGGAAAHVKGRGGADDCSRTMSPPARISAIRAFT